MQTEKCFHNLEEISSTFRLQGCDQILVKFLAPNQDNEKNQVYFGPALAIAQYFPGVLEFRSASSSTTKSRSKYGSSIVSLSLDFAWLWPNHEPAPAPSAKIIEYSQYPEVRFSGFLEKCVKAPDALRRDKQDLYGARALVLGISGERTFGALITQDTSPQAFVELEKLEEWPLQRLFRYKKLNRSTTSMDPISLLRELREIAGIVHEPRRLRRSGSPFEFMTVGGQAGGWTLEALLGIPMNAASAPDKYGFEIKAVGGDRTSLITTEPDFGYRFEYGVSAYLSKFGRDARAGGGARVFSGVHRCNQLNAETQAVLTIENWDFVSNQPNGLGQPNIVLTDQSTGQVISGWSFGKIGASWTKKHAGAVYVQTSSVVGFADEGYTYGPLAYLGLGTSALRFIEQVASGNIFLDPGDSQKPNMSPHARTQWRIAGNIKSLLPARLEPLYDSLVKEVLY